MECHYNRNLNKKNFVMFTTPVNESRVAIVKTVFDKNPVVNQMIYGYDAMKVINQEIVAEYAEVNKQDLTKILIDLYSESPKINDAKGHLK